MYRITIAKEGRIAEMYVGMCDTSGRVIQGIVDQGWAVRIDNVDEREIPTNLADVNREATKILDDIFSPR